MTQTIRLLKVKGTRGLSVSLPTTTSGKLMGIAVASLLLLGACASAPLPPTAELQAAEQAITNAERARVADYASVELSEARDKLAAAHNAVKIKEMNRAQRLAQQAQADAELATARAEVAKARVVNDQMQKGTDTLKQEMQRTTGDK